MECGNLEQCCRGSWSANCVGAGASPRGRQSYSEAQIPQWHSKRCWGKPGGKYWTIQTQVDKTLIKIYHYPTYKFLVPWNI